MRGQLVPLKKSAERIAAEETKRKKERLKWADDIADKAITAALEEAGLPFDDFDDEELGSRDLTGPDFDPILNEKTGARLSDAFDEYAERFKEPAKIGKRLYLRALRAKWKKQRREIRTDPVGKNFYGAYMTTKHGVWTKLNAGGPGLFVWRRICRTRIDPDALSRDMSPQRNWRHRYLVTDETGQFPVEIGNELLVKKADRAITILIRHGIHVVETDDARQHLAIFLRYRPRARIVRVPRTGWFGVKSNRWVFVLPDETLGDAGPVGVVLDKAITTGAHR